MSNEKKLTEEQKAVITSPEKKVCVCAEAGSGKTSVLVGRYMWLVRAGVDPSKMACITFTRAAATEMRDRLMTNTKYAEGVKKSQISTFHVLGKRLIKVMPEYQDKRIQVLSDKHLEQIMPLDSFHPLSKSELIEFIHGAKESLLTSKSDLTAFCKKERELEGRQKLFQQAFSVYEEKMQSLNAQGVFDIPDLVYIPTKRMEEDIVFRDKVQSMFDGILVDEFQDVNTMQATMLSLMCTDKTNALIVGDDDQSIYAWRGAVAMMLQRQAARWEIPIMKLSCNFRCPQPIVAVSECFVKDNVGRIKKEMQAANFLGEKPSLKVSEGEAEEIKDIVKQVKEWGEARVKRGVPEEERYGNEIAILTRTRILAEKIRSALESAGISTCSTSESSNVIVKCDAIIKWALGEADERLFMSLSMDPVCKEVLNKLEKTPNLKEEIAEKNLQASRPSSFINDLLNMQKSTDFVSMIEKFKKIGFFTTEEKKVLEKTIEPVCKGLTLEQVYSKLENALISGNSKSGQKEKGNLVTVSTIHGVKGLEYESVIVDMTHGVFGKKDKIISEEELRLAYVASTRAMKDLVYMADKSQGVSPILTENVDASLVKGLEKYALEKVEFDFSGCNFKYLSPEECNIDLSGAVWQKEKDAPKDKDSTKDKAQEKTVVQKKTKSKTVSD